MNIIFKIRSNYYELHTSSEQVLAAGDYDAIRAAADLISPGNWRYSNMCEDSTREIIEMEDNACFELIETQILLLEVMES